MHRVFNYYCLRAQQGPFGLSPSWVLETQKQVKLILMVLNNSATACLWRTSFIIISYVLSCRSFPSYAEPSKLSYLTGLGRDKARAQPWGKCPTWCQATCPDFSAHLVRLQVQALGPDLTSGISSKSTSIVTSLNGQLRALLILSKMNAAQLNQLCTETHSINRSNIKPFNNLP